MLFPLTRAWTPLQKWAIILSTATAILLSTAGIYRISGDANRRHAENKRRNVAVAVFGGDVAFKQFLNAKKIMAQRLYLKQTDASKAWPYSLASYIHDPEVDLSRAQVDALHALFASQTSYLWTHDVPDDTPVMVKLCLPDYGVLFTCTSADFTVQIAICMKCDLFAVFVGAGNGAKRVNREEDLDAMKPGLAKLLGELFPLASDITEIRLKSSNQGLQPTAGGVSIYGNLADSR